MVYICCFLLHTDVQILEFGTFGTQIQVMVFMWCVLLYIDARILQLRTVGT